MPTLIGKDNYRDPGAYLAARFAVAGAKTALFNPASYILYKKAADFVPFDNVIIDEADACLSLFKILNPTTADWNEDWDLTPANIERALIESGKESTAEYFKNNQHRFWWEVERFVTKKKVKASLKVHEVELNKSFAKHKLANRVIGMSGTMFPSYCKELFGSDEYAYLELPSPIPVERRLIHGLTQENGWCFPTDYEDMVALLEIVLKRFQERPAIVHTTYSDSRMMLALNDKIRGYLTKEDKMVAIQSIHSTEDVMLTPGAVEGISLNDDAARLNILMRAQFANLGNIAVQKRMALPGGQQWYKEQTLRGIVQSMGRTTRTPTDFSTCVIADCRATRLIKENMDLLPAYFKEALRF
jgi:Rad3-related DNA helicase